MTWALGWSDKAIKQLRELDGGQRRIILAWMVKNVDGCDDPRTHGKALVADRTGVWRYRVGDYRILCEIRDTDLVVLALEVSHRREVCRRKR